MKPHTPTDKGINMKSQETAQERAEKYVHKKYGLCSDLSEQVQSDFIAGEESGERITLERLADEEVEGFEEFFDQYDSIRQYPVAQDVWTEARKPLVAKIELQDKRIQELLSELTKDGK
jgi:hypothetical protein